MWGKGREVEEDQGKVGGRGSVRRLSEGLKQRPKDLNEAKVFPSAIWAVGMGVTEQMRDLRGPTN